MLIILLLILYVLEEFTLNTTCMYLYTYIFIFLLIKNDPRKCFKALNSLDELFVTKDMKIQDQGGKNWEVVKLLTVAKRTSRYIIK